MYLNTYQQVYTSLYITYYIYYILLKNCFSMLIKSNIEIQVVSRRCLNRILVYKNSFVSSFKSSTGRRYSTLKKLFCFYCTKRVLRRIRWRLHLRRYMSDKTLLGILSLKREFKLKQDGVTPSSWIRNSWSMSLLWYPPSGRKVS